MTEPPFSPKANREKMMKLMFDKFGVAAVYLANTATLSLCVHTCRALDLHAPFVAACEDVHAQACESVQGRVSGCCLLCLLCMLLSWQRVRGCCPVPCARAWLACHITGILSTHTHTHTHTRVTRGHVHAGAIVTARWPAFHQSTRA